MLASEVSGICGEKGIWRYTFAPIVHLYWILYASSEHKSQNEEVKIITTQYKIILD